jgi:hypothetical protein
MTAPPAVVPHGGMVAAGIVVGVDVAAVTCLLLIQYGRRCSVACNHATSWIYQMRTNEHKSDEVINRKMRRLIMTASHSCEITQTK